MANTILITGGTGSFGRAFARFALTQNVKKVIIFSRDELKQSEIGRYDQRLRFFLGDVRDLERLRLAFREVDIVVHAAALKQVPKGEYDPTEFIDTNVIGSKNVTRAAMDCGVEQCLLLSSDKACNPLNLYGATKLCAEKMFLAANNQYGEYGPRFSVTRYGNVMGSRGSVVSLFRTARPVPVTHMEMTRFFMHMHEAVNLVHTALTNMRGGEIFVPKLPSFHVRDLAAAIAPDVPIAVTGIRPGEKLHESLIGPDEPRIDHGTHYTIEPGEVGEAYTSLNNDKWLGVEDLQGELEMVP